SQEEVAAGGMPRIVSSIQEVEALGGTTKWIGKQKPSWSPSAKCLFLLERPDGDVTDHSGFGIELDGRLYAVSAYYASGTAYSVTAKLIFNTSLTTLLIPVLDEEGKPK